MAKKKVLRLNYTIDNSIYAVCYNGDEFSFIQHITDELQINFKVQEPQQIVLNSGRKVLYSYYSGQCEKSHAKVFIASNKISAHRLIESLESVDFLVTISADDYIKQQIADRIKSIPNVLLMQHIDVDKLPKKQKDNILYLFY